MTYNITPTMSCSTAVNDAQPADGEEQKIMPRKLTMRGCESH
jgi:hypothetical protein